MYADEQIDEFILMRSHGMTIRDIAISMNIARSTIQEWCAKYSMEIADTRQGALEAAMREIGMDKIERMKALGSIYKKMYEYISEESSIHFVERIISLFLRIHKELENGGDDMSHIKLDILRQVALKLETEK
jgi:hypothetical protein